MDFCSINSPAADLILATAIHAGHDLRPALAGIMALDDAERLREEDPHTGSVASRFPASVVVHRSRFEVDLNRPRHGAVYRTPEEAWGLDVWDRPLPDEEVAESQWLYDGFYSQLASILDEHVSRFGGFVLYDIHSYNHRRAGAHAAPEQSEGNPTVNLGTGTLPERWRPVADAFLTSMRDLTLDGLPLDTRENVRFEGGQMARWVHERYGDVGCALAIELKKVFMDEWSGELDSTRLEQLGAAVLASGDAVREAFDLE